GVHRARARRNGDPRAQNLPHHDHRKGPVKKNLDRVENLERRIFMRQSLSLGALSLLTGCELTSQTDVQRVLSTMASWNDSVQGWIFNPSRLAPEFPESRITRPFPFNAYYGEDEVRYVNGANYKLELAGSLIRDKKPWTLPELYALPQVAQVTR